MNVGELFFSLGFKSEGLGEAKNFENAITASNDVTELLTQSMQKFGEILEKMAVKMGAITQAELTEIKSHDLLAKGLKTINLAEKQGNIEKLKGQGILANLNTKMKAYWGNLATARIQLLGATTALTYFVKKASDAAVHIDKISSLTGLSSNTIQRMGDMAAQTGASVDDLAGAVSHFQKQSVDIMLGRGGNIGAFQFMGLNPHEDPLKILDQLSAKLKTMPTALGTSMAKDLGLSDDLIYFLKNKENLAPASEETLLTDKEIKRLKDFNFYFNRIFEQSKRALQKFAAFLTPIASQVIYFFDRLGTMFSDITNKMEPFFGKLQQYMPWLVGIGAALFAAFFPLTASLLVVALVLEDIWSFVRGDDSLFGRMFNWLTDINGALKDVIHFYIQFRKLMTLGQHDEYFDNMEKDLLSGAKGFLERQAEDDKDPQRKTAVKQIIRAADKQMDAIKFDPKGGFERLLGITKKPITDYPGNMKSSTNNNNITVNINEAKTPQETGKAVSTEIQKAFWQNQGGEK